MTDNTPSSDRSEADEITHKARRKQEARRESRRSPLFGFGMFGLVGWAVTIPTVLGIALGVWIDAQTGADGRWTLALMLAGVALGCLNAWFWVQRESRDD